MADNQQIAKEIIGVLRNKHFDVGPWTEIAIAAVKARLDKYFPEQEKRDKQETPSPD